MKLALLIAICFPLAICHAQPETNLPPLEKQLVTQLLSRATHPKTPPDPNPADAALDVEDNPQYIITNSVNLVFTWFDTNTTQILLLDGPSSGQYNETNAIPVTPGTTSMVYTLETANGLPIYSAGIATDVADTPSALGNEVGFNGYIPYDWTNWLYVTNLTAIGRQLWVSNGIVMGIFGTRTNAALAIFTNDPGPLFLQCDGYRAFPTYYLKLAPLPLEATLNPVLELP